MKSFILDRLEEILCEWERVAGTLSPAADTFAARLPHHRQAVAA